MAERQTASALFYGDAVTDVATSTGQKYPLGTKREEEGKIYRYINYDGGTGSIAAVAGQVCFHKDGDWDCTSDISDSKRNLVAGVLISVIADEGYGWVLTRGRYSAVVTNGDDDISDGDAIIASTGDGTVDSVAAGTAPTHKVVGWALADDVNGSNTVDTFVEIE